MAGGKPLVRQGGRTQQGNISIESVTGLSSALGAKVSDDDPRLSDSREWTASTVPQAEAEAGTATTARKWTAQRVAQAIGSLGLKIGTTSTTAAAGNDSRLSDSREWSATTVTQAEAEAGTASTRRAWTAQRVRQAIVAWFNGISGALGRTILSRTTAAEMRGDLGLGTAATRDVGTDSGNVMQVGAFGLGRMWRRIAGDNTSTPTSIFASIKSSSSDLIPVHGEGGNFFNLQMKYYDDGREDDAILLLGAVSGIVDNAVYIRTKPLGKEWNPAEKLLTSGNIRSTTGNSTEYPMTQKAVTDALNTKANTSALGWISRAIGEEIWLDDSNPAVDVPPTDNPNFRFIKLTAGENGSGGYNEGILINETVSGSAPLINATAKVNLPDSPFHGQTVRLLNTERRFVRAGEAGVVQNDQMQRITGSIGHVGDSWAGATGAFTKISSKGTGGVSDTNRGCKINFNSALSPDARVSAATDGETRPRNVGRSIYMRIK